MCWFSDTGLTVERISPPFGGALGGFVSDYSVGGFAGAASGDFGGAAAGMAVDAVTGAVVGGPAGAIVGAGIGAVGDLIESGLNYGNQQSNLQYQKDLQQEVFARDDNAVQRRVDDLRKAGLSPTLAAGSAAEAGPVVSTQAPQLNLGATDKAVSIAAQAGNALDLAQKEADVNQTKAQTAFIQQQASQSAQQNPLDLRAKQIANQLNGALTDVRVQSAISQLKGQDISNANSVLDGEIKKNNVDISLYQAAVAKGTVSSQISLAAQDVAVKAAALIGQTIQNTASAGQAAQSMVGTQYWVSKGMSPEAANFVLNVQKQMLGSSPSFSLK